MSDSSTYTELLIQYLDGELPDEESSRLEKEINASQVLREKLENLRAARRSVRLLGLQQQVNTIHGEMMPQLRKPTLYVKMRRVGLWAAAALMLIVSATALYQYQQLSPVSLYQDNFRPYAIRESRGMGDSTGLLQPYKEGKPDAVVRFFGSLPSPGVRDYFLAGNAYLALDKPEQAVHCFLEVQEKNRQQQTHLFEDDTEYYLAMSYLKAGKPIPAIPIFEKIYHDPTHLYHDRVSGRFLRKLHWLH